MLTYTILVAYKNELIKTAGKSRCYIFFPIIYFSSLSKGKGVGVQ